MSTASSATASPSVTAGRTNRFNRSGPAGIPLLDPAGGSNGGSDGGFYGGAGSDGAKPASSARSMSAKLRDAMGRVAASTSSPRAKARPNPRPRARGASKEHAVRGEAEKGPRGAAAAASSSPRPAPSTPAKGLFSALGRSSSPRPPTDGGGPARGSSVPPPPQSRISLAVASVTASALGKPASSASRATSAGPGPRPKPLKKRPNPAIGAVESAKRDSRASDEMHTLQLDDVGNGQFKTRGVSYERSSPGPDGGQQDAGSPPRTPTRKAEKPPVTPTTPGGVPGVVSGSAFYGGGVRGLASPERPMSPRVLAELPLPGSHVADGARDGAAAAAAAAASLEAAGGSGGELLLKKAGRGKQIVFDGTFRGWSYSSRPDIRLADLTAVDFLGEGHFGQVKCVAWEPRAEGSEAKVRRGLFALKILERERFENKVVASGRSEEYYIFNEREIMIELDSPFHIKLINTYKSAKNLYILMEYAPGRNLKDQVDRNQGLQDDFLADGKGSPGSGAGSGSTSRSMRGMSRVKFYAANLVLALSHLHAKQIMHRDIKPSNLLIDEQGYLKVCDYGFARWMPIGGRTRSIAGTYNYLTPEQAVDAEYGHDVDLWCLGITVYNMTYGVTPFEAPEGATDWQRVTIDNILNKKLRFLDNRKELPMAGKLFIRSLLMRKPEERFGYDLDYSTVTKHAWFSDVDFDAIERRQMKAPWLPGIDDP